LHSYEGSSSAGPAESLSIGVPAYLYRVTAG
jgi:hypothetical protein